MSRDLPSPKTVDTWFEQIKSDTEWLYDAKLGRSGAYAWSYSAVDGLRSQLLATLNSGQPADPTARDGAQKKLSRAQRAAKLIREASVALKAARKILEERDLTPTEGDNIVFLRKGELDQLYRRQREREMQGGGFGAT